MRVRKQEDPKKKKKTMKASSFKKGKQSPEKDYLQKENDFYKKNPYNPIKLSELIKIRDPKEFNSKVEELSKMYSKAKGSKDRPPIDVGVSLDKLALLEYQARRMQANRRAGYSG